jgi:hypothetical protein
MTRPRLSLLHGNLIELVGTLVAFALNHYAPSLGGVYVRFALYLLSFACLIFFPHCLAHFIIGTLVGIKFDYYSIRESSISRLNLPISFPRLPVLSLKVNRESLKHTNPFGRGAMFASGAIVSVLLPFIVVASALPNIPQLPGMLLLVLAIANAAFDLYYSPRAGDFSRMRTR